jgi:hypothetical protein
VCSDLLSICGQVDATYTPQFSSPESNEDAMLLPEEVTKFVIQWLRKWVFDYGTNSACELDHMLLMGKAIAEHCTAPEYVPCLRCSGTRFICMIQDCGW